jgi:D-lactate dehydrogenase
MKIAVFSAERYDREFLDKANVVEGHQLTISKTRSTFRPLTWRRAMTQSAYSSTIPPTPPCWRLCNVEEPMLSHCAAPGSTMSTSLRRSAWASRSYASSPIPPILLPSMPLALLLAINRKIHRAYNRTRDSNFALDGLMGFDLHGKTVAVIGTGKIGRVFARIMLGFGCDVIGYDKYPSPEFEGMGARYVTSGEIGAQTDIISLHCPLTPETHHIINAETLARAKPGALLINTSRGGLVHTEAAIDALKSGQLGGLGLDVYEQERIFFSATYRALLSLTMCCSA